MKFFEHKRFLIVVIFLLYCDDASARRNARRNRPMERKRKAKCSKPDPVEHAELGEKYEKKNKFKDGDKIKYNCEKGYMEDGTSTERMCKKGKWSEVQFSCEVSKCNMITNFIGGSVDYFGERSLYSQAFYSCYENYTLIPPNVDFSTCEKNQQWRPPPPACHRKAEILIPENGYLIGKKRSGVLHGEKYQICCNNGFEVESAGIFTHEIKTCQTIRNNNGTLEPKVQCLEERCSFNASEACFLEDDNRKCRRDDFKIQSGSSVNIRCDSRHQLFVSGKMVKEQGSLNCKHGSYSGFKCMPSCTLSDDQRYTYFDMKNTEIKPGDKIAVGMKLKLQCKFIDIYSFLTYDYENYTYNEDSVEPIVTCNDDNEMSQHYLTCPEGNEGDECMKVDNGEVRKSNFGYYIVSCNDGFSLETIVPEGERCTCNNGHLTNIIGGQPKCLPDPCLVPYDFDSRISISNRHFVSLSCGSVVQVGEIVFFNCSKSSDGLYEPFNRTFKCKNGLWVEDERDKAWTLGNNGTFPECRKAKCEPKCQNGGFCYKDNFCRCKHLTEGKHCEQVICDNECKANGGKCIGPGKCECPLDRFGSNCEIIGCKLPDLENMKNLQFSKDVFAPGETIHTFQCEPGYFLSANHGMTCQKDGLWSDEVDCVKGIVYLISTNTGSRRYAGTNAKVDLTLLGAGGSTRRIDFDGSFERNNVDVMRTMAKDIRPIKSVHIEHDGSGVGPGWYLDYVSIYVENVEEFYIFRNRERLWVMEDKDLTLSKEVWLGNDGNDECIDSFGRELKWYPLSNTITQFHVGHGAGMSIRACKQGCIF